MAFLPMVFYIFNFCIGEVVQEGLWHWLTRGVQIGWRVARVENLASTACMICHDLRTGIKDTKDTSGSSLGSAFLVSKLLLRM
jgi:hypothetical protein